MLVRVLLVDDHQQTRVSLRRQLERHGPLVVVGEASNGLDVLKLIEQVPADVLLLDIEMKGMSGLEVMRRFGEVATSIHVLSLSSCSDPAFIFEMLAYGVAGYLSKEDPIDVIVNAVCRVAGGERCQLSPSLWNILEQHKTLRSSWPFPRQERRQIRDVIRLVAAGYPDKQIAEHLKVPVKRVEEIIIQVRDALTLRDRAEVVAWGWAQGLVEPPSSIRASAS